MQNLQDIQEKIFFEAKTALESLSKINSIDELLAKQDLFSEVRDRIAFLRILEKNSSSFVVEEASQIIDNQHLNQNTQVAIARAQQSRCLSPAAPSKDESHRSMPAKNP